MARRATGAQSEPLDQVIRSLGQEELAEVVLGAAERHDDVAAAVRLVAARSGDDLVALRGEVDHALRTRRFLGYWEASGRAHVNLRLAVPERPGVSGRCCATARPGLA